MKSIFSKPVLALAILFSISAAQASYIQKAPTGGGGGASWGSITGTLSDQTDLQDALDDKLDAALVEEQNLFIETAADKTYALVAKAAYGRTINSLRGLACSSGTVTAALQIAGVGVTGCTSISVTSTPQDVTCTAANAISTGNRVTLVLSSNSSCLNLEGTLQSTR